MDKNSKCRKVIVKYLNVMKACAEKFDFRMQVLVDDLQWTMENDWIPRLKQEKAQKLDDLHRDFAEQNRPNNHRQHSQHRDYRNGGGGRHNAGDRDRGDRGNRNRSYENHNGYGR